VADTFTWSEVSLKGLLLMRKLGKKALYLSKSDVESLSISISEIIHCLEMMFIEKAEGRVEMPPKPAIHTNGDAFLHAMPAFIPKINSAGMKWVGGYPENHKQGLPYISGLLVLNDTATGIPYAIMDCIWITAIRTAAATALAARYMARPDSKTVAILGCGVQGRYNLKTLVETFSLSKIQIYDVSDDAARRYQTEMTSIFNFKIEIADTPEAAVKEADIIVTAGPFLTNPKPVIEFGWIKKGAFICPLDLDSYVKPEVFQKSDFMCTDDIGQFEHFRATGLFQSCPKNIEDLAAVINGKIEGRKSDDDVITSINIGIALEDMSVAPLVYKKAREKNIGIWLDL
jgi:ornithine cyclodeaminase/alanine dehydrogenase-like protein (mu-crystallin family)